MNYIVINKKGRDASWLHLGVYKWTYLAFMGSREQECDWCFLLGDNFPLIVISVIPIKNYMKLDD